MNWYERGDKDTHKLVQKVMKQWHRELFDEKVTIDVVVAHTDKGQTAIPIGRGLFALATIRIIGLKDRSMGRADAEMMIDADTLRDSHELRLEALIDHELTHLVLHRSKKTNLVLRDDQDRPRLKIRYHDHEFGWFDAPVRHYGAHAVEYEQAQKLILQAGWIQPMLPGIDEAA